MIDVMPTLLDLAGVSNPTLVMGRSVKPLLTGGELDKVLAISELNTFGRELSSYRKLDRKLIRHEPTNSMVVFNLRRDPGEQKPRRNPNKPIYSVMVREMQAGREWLAEFRTKPGWSMYHRLYCRKRCSVG